MIRPRHRVTLYRHRADTGAPSPPLDEFGEPIEGGGTASGWDPVPLAVDVPANLQPLTGSVRASAAGREVGATWKMFLDPRDLPDGVLIRADDGLVVTEGRSPARLRVVQSGYRSAGWKDEFLLAETAEAIP